MTYTVTHTIQGQRIDAGAPVEVQWYKGDNLAKALVALMQAAEPKDTTYRGRDGEDVPLPPAAQVRVLSATIKFDED